jgi:hypothetical protein
MQGTHAAVVLCPGFYPKDPETALAQASAAAAEQALGYTPGSQVNITPGPPLDLSNGTHHQLWDAAVVDGSATGEHIHKLSAALAKTHA